MGTSWELDGNTLTIDNKQTKNYPLPPQIWRMNHDHVNLYAQPLQCCSLMSCEWLIECYIEGCSTMLFVWTFYLASLIDWLMWTRWLIGMETRVIIFHKLLGWQRVFYIWEEFSFFFELVSRWKHVFNVRICKLDGDFVGHEPTS
jgi:hypothetical protein